MLIDTAAKKFFSIRNAFAYEDIGIFLIFQNVKAL